MLSSQSRQQIVHSQTRKALANITPNCPGNVYSGHQLAAARGIGRKRAMAMIDVIDHADRQYVTAIKNDDLDFAQAVLAGRDATLLRAMDN